MYASSQAGLGANMRRNYLKKGDRSTMGGVVVEGIRSMTHHGTELTFLGARVSCSACGTTGVIIPKGPRWPDNLMGKHAALDGDLCLCKCHPMPTMLSSQSDMFETFDAHHLSEMGFSPKGGALEPVAVGPFDEQVRVLDRDGRPLSNVPYHIRARNGVTYKGLTDSQGHCERVHTDEPEDMEIAVGHRALERWNS